jgi:multiple sugar transport system ATP-binding protein
MTAEVLEAAADGLLPAERALFTARVDTRTRARVGEAIELAVDPARFHFFDPDTGDALSGTAAPLLAAS